MAGADSLNDLVVFPGHEHKYLNFFIIVPQDNRDLNAACKGGLKQ